jgi:hypothetical protein
MRQVHDHKSVSHCHSLSIQLSIHTFCQQALPITSFGLVSCQLLGTQRPGDLVGKPPVLFSCVSTSCHKDRNFHTIPSTSLMQGRATEGTLVPSLLSHFSLPGKGGISNPIGQFRFSQLHLPSGQGYCLQTFPLRFALQTLVSCILLFLTLYHEPKRAGPLPGVHHST